MNETRILFIGCVESSYRLLSVLIEAKKKVVGVITREQSNFNSDFVDIVPFCEKHRIPFVCVRNINDKDSLDFVKSLSPNVGFCFGWSQLLKEEFIELFPLGVVGFHPAALPNNRGRHPLIWALALGLNETASTFFMMNAGADEGDIISQRKIAIAYEDDARNLYDKVMNIAVKQEMEIVDAFERGGVQKICQGSNTGNSWRKRQKADGEIDWRMSSRSIYNLVRSLTRPYVGAHFVFDAKDYKVWKVQELSVNGVENFEPGKVLSVNGDGTIDVKVADGAIRLLEFDIPKVKAGDYL